MLLNPHVLTGVFENPMITARPRRELGVQKGNNLIHLKYPVFVWWQTRFWHKLVAQWLRPAEPSAIVVGLENGN